MRQAVALNTLANQDWKTQLARGYSNIPNMAIVDVIEENFTNPKSNSLRKYGAYALGALAATALVNTLFFGDKKGEQTNAQLYGQQPLY